MISLSRNGGFSSFVDIQGAFHEKYGFIYLFIFYTTVV